MNKLYTLSEAASVLRHKSPRSLKAWLRQQPVGLDGLPLFTLRGRAKIFSELDLDRIRAVDQVLSEGWRTGDIMQPGMKKAGTREMADAILKALDKLAV